MLLLAVPAFAGSSEVKLTASDAQAGDLFGSSVAIYGDVAVVGAYADDDHRGAAYVYVRCRGVWELQARLTACTFPDRCTGWRSTIR